MKMKAFLLCLGTLSLGMCCSIHAGKGVGNQPNKNNNNSEQNKQPPPQLIHNNQNQEKIDTQQLPLPPNENNNNNENTKVIQKSQDDTTSTDDKKESDDKNKTVAKKTDRLWSLLSTRKNRVLVALENYNEYTQAEEYLKSQDGRNQVVRELELARANLTSQDLTKDSDDLKTIITILTRCNNLGIEINLQDVRNAWQEVRDTKASVTSNLNKRLKDLRDKFMQEASAEFEKEAQLIALLAQTQHTAAAMRKKRADDPGNLSDTEGKEWTLEHVFEVLSDVNQPKTDGTLGVTISLQPTAPKEDKKD